MQEGVSAHRFVQGMGVTGNTNESPCYHPRLHHKFDGPRSSTYEHSDYIVKLPGIALI